MSSPLESKDFGRTGRSDTMQMKAALFGRIVFGGSAALFGVIALLWHDAETWQGLRQVWRLPLGAIIGVGLMTLQIAGGIGIVYPRTARTAAMSLAIVYLLFSLACIPAIVAAPATYVTYGSFFEQFTLLCGAIAVCAASDTTAARSIAFGRFARVGLGLCATSFMLSQIFYLRVTADLVPKWIPPNQTFWAILTTLAFALAAIATFTNQHTRFALIMLTLMLSIFGLFVWIPALIAHPESHTNWSECSLTFLITGATWTVADLRS